MPLTVPSSGGSFATLSGSPGDNAALAAALAAKLDLTGGTLTPAANTTALTLSGSLTGSNAQPGLSVAQVWNTTGAPALIYGRATNTASGSSAKLLDLGTVAGGSLFYIRKDGLIHTNFGIEVGNIYNTGGGQTASNGVNVSGAGTFACFQVTGAVLVNSGSQLFYGGSGSPEGSLTANPGSIYGRNNSGTGELWLKTSGTGNTGWTLIA